MVLLGRPTDLVRHRVPSHRKLVLVLATAVAVCVAAAALLVRQYNERPPWADDIAYEGGYLQATRIRKADVSGERTRQLLHGGCARMQSEGIGGQRAAHNPQAWVAGCLDAAAGRQSGLQGLLW